AADYSRRRAALPVRPFGVEPVPAAAPAAGRSVPLVTFRRIRPVCDTHAMTIALITALAYLAAAGLLIRGMVPGRSTPVRGWLLAPAPATLLHAGYHVAVAWRTSGGPDMHFFSALSLVGLGMAAMTMLVGARGRMAALGVFVFPLAAVLLLATQLRGPAPAPVLEWRLQLHAWLALLAYAALAIAALLAVMLWLQERALRQRAFNTWLRALP